MAAINTFILFNVRTLWFYYVLSSCSLRRFIDSLAMPSLYLDFLLALVLIESRISSLHHLLCFHHVGVIGRHYLFTLECLMSGIYFGEWDRILQSLLIILANFTQVLVDLKRWFLLKPYFRRFLKPTFLFFTRLVVYLYWSRVYKPKALSNWIFI